MSTFTVFVIFAGLVIGAITRIVKIQREEYIAVRDAKIAAAIEKEKREARLKEYRAKCFRPDGD